MNLKELARVKRKAWCPHYLQSCQTIATATFEDGTTFTGIYDHPTGHWLTLPEKREVGYLSTIAINGTEKRAIAFDEWNTNSPPSERETPGVPDRYNW